MKTQRLNSDKTQVKHILQHFMKSEDVFYCTWRLCGVSHTLQTPCLVFPVRKGIWGAAGHKCRAASWGHVGDSFHLQVEPQALSRLPSS